MAERLKCPSPAACFKMLHVWKRYKKKKNANSAICKCLQKIDRQSLFFLPLKFKKDIVKVINVGIYKFGFVHDYNIKSMYPSVHTYKFFPLRDYQRG